jgi:ATP-binding cassette subfamily B protein
MNKIKAVFSDVLYVSKLTGTQNKKILIMGSVFLSQLSALTDISLIAIFAVIITNQYTNIELVNSFLNFVIEYKFIIIIFVMLRFLFNYQQSMIIKKIEESSSKNLKVYLLTEIFNKRNYSIADSYYYINILSGHISFFYSSFASFLNSFLQIVFYSGYLFISNTKTVLVFFIGVLVIIYPVRKLLLLARKYMHISYERGKESNEEIQRVVENLYLIKILNKESDELRNFSETLDKFKVSMIKNHSISLMNGYLPSFVTMIILSILLVTNIFAKTITLDFIGVTLRMFQAVGNLTTSINRLVNSQVHIEKFQKIDENKFIQNKQNFKVVPDSNQINFQKLWFKYFNSESHIFEDVSLSINRNSHTLIIGDNGSGKSTLLGLLAGVYYSEKGFVETYSDKFGYIGATPLIFESTLYENLLYGNEKEIEEKVLISYLKMLDTFKEESGYILSNKITNKSLSSGQMQKIAFIRALLSDIDILLLDEATANLDEKTKNKIFNLLQEKKVTIINSTHDPKSFKNVDNIIKISIQDEKRIVSLNLDKV